jgi:maltooligosyltrehalose trehalohydrolase
VPDPQDPETFQRSKLDWEESGKPFHAGLLGFYRDLGRLRLTHPSFTDPRFDGVAVSFDDTEAWLVLHRGAAEVAVNFSAETRVVPTRGGQVLLAFPESESSSSVPEAAAAAGAAGAVLPPYSVVVRDSPA